jgi:hypothetical protein
LFSATLHRIPLAAAGKKRAVESALQKPVTNPLLPRRKKVQDQGAGFTRPADLQSQRSRKHSE